jgi:UDP-glucose 4-epimerase
VLNLGGGTGTTVMEVIAAVERVTGRRVPVERVGRRAGDPSSLVADIEQAGATLAGRRADRPWRR